MSGTRKDRFWNRIRQILACIGLVFALALLGGFFGFVHPALDGLSVARILTFAMSVLLLFAFRAAWLRFLTAVTCGFALASIAVTLVPGPDKAVDFSVYSKNLWANDLQTEALLDDITASDTDAVFLQYIGQEHSDLLRALSAPFPHRHLCDFDGNRAIAILTRVPQEEGARCADVYSMAAARVVVNDQKIWLASVHLAKPWPFGDAAAERASDALLQTLFGTSVIVGDFNAAGWSARVGQMSTLTETELARPILPTMTLFFVPLPIDLALAPGGGRIERRGHFGSDHRGILAHLSLSK